MQVDDKGMGVGEEWMTTSTWSRGHGGSKAGNVRRNQEVVDEDRRGGSSLAPSWASLGFHAAGLRKWYQSGEFCTMSILCCSETCLSKHVMLEPVAFTA